MAYATSVINGVTKLEQGNGDTLWQFPICSIEVKANKTAYQLYYPGSPDSPSSTQEFADIPIGQRFGATDIYEYVDALATNSFFFKAVGNNFNGLKVIAQKSDLPEASAGVIQLANRTIYYFTGTVDLTGDRLQGGIRSALVSATPEIGIIKSTGLSASTALLTATSTIALNFIGLEHATILNLDATTAGADDKAIDWTGVNFSNATTAVGTIKSYDNAVMTLIGFLNSGGLTLDGSMGTVAFRDTIFNNATGLTSIIIPATCTITRRFRILDSSFISTAGETALNVSASATIPNEGYILRNLFFSGGGTYITGVQYNDNKARFEGCRGIENSGTFGQLYMKANATATTFAGANTPTKILGTTTAGALIERFSMSANNELTLSGAISRKFLVEAIASVSGGANKDFDLYIAKNGTAVASSKSRSSTGTGGRADNVASIDALQLNPSADTISAYLANASDATSLTVVDLTLVISPIAV